MKIAFKWSWNVLYKYDQWDDNLFGNGHPLGSFCLCLVRPLYKSIVSWILPWNFEFRYGEIRAKNTSSKKFAMTNYLVKELWFFMYEIKTACMTIYLHTRPIVKLKKKSRKTISHKQRLREIWLVCRARQNYANQKAYSLHNCEHNAKSDWAK